MQVTWMECVLAGILVFSLVGTGSLMLFLAGLVRLIRSDTSFLDALKGIGPGVVASAATAAAVTGGTAWRLIVAMTDSHPTSGAMAGLVVGLVAHPLCWFLFLLFQVARDSTLRGQSVSSLVFGLVWMTATFTFSSLLGFRLDHRAALRRPRLPVEEDQSLGISSPLKARAIGEITRIAG
jgi:hypothetical protein